MHPLRRGCTHFTRHEARTVGGCGRLQTHSTYCLSRGSKNHRRASARVPSPLGMSAAARCNSACFWRTAAIVLVATTLGQRSQHVADAATVTTTCASSKPALDCSIGMVVEECVQRRVSISSLCYCLGDTARYCSDICRGESKSQQCTSNCPEFSEHEEKPCSLPDPKNDLPIAWIVGSVLFVSVLIVVISFAVTFVRYRRRASRTGGAPSFRGYMKFLRCASNEVVGVCTEQDNPFPGVDVNVTDNNSDNPMTPLRHEQPNESINGTTVAGSGRAHD